ncbi:hypothetical protein EVAR_47279_1 [Eumeta japonica]|uniref:Uncharacterized protein n=1 Tax=Eumeta variegata TaxID=151549 RepID=A0A4C1Z0U5_EUMVA|nr:hypothetical protein EVAR_47279_1 [Eumeta japonica]
MFRRRVGLVKAELALVKNRNKKIKRFTKLKAELATSDHDQRLIMKSHLEPLCFGRFQTFGVDAIHFNMKKIREIRFHSRICSPFSQMIKNDNQCTSHVIQITLGIGSSAVYKILYENRAGPRPDPPRQIEWIRIVMGLTILNHGSINFVLEAPALLPYEHPQQGYPNHYYKLKTETDRGSNPVAPPSDQVSRRSRVIDIDLVNPINEI